MTQYDRQSNKGIQVLFLEKLKSQREARKSEFMEAVKAGRIHRQKYQVQQHQKELVKHHEECGGDDTPTKKSESKAVYHSNYFRESGRKRIRGLANFH